MCNFIRIVEDIVKPAVSKSKPRAGNTSYKIIGKLSVLSPSAKVTDCIGKIIKCIFNT